MDKEIETKEIKTADYTRRAVDHYRKQRDVFNVALEKGTREKIYKKYGEKISMKKYFQSLVDADLNDGKQEPKKSATKSAPAVKADDHADDLNDPALIFENYKEK